MHSSRMRTVRSSGRISGGGCVPGRGDAPGPKGGVPGPGGVYLVPLGCTWSQGGVPGPRGCTWSQGVYLVPGGAPGPRGGTWSGTPPCGQTHACKNITFATSLRTVIILLQKRRQLGYQWPHKWSK